MTIRAVPDPPVNVNVFEDFGHVPLGELVGEQVLELFELVAGTLVDGHLQLAFS